MLRPPNYKILPRLLPLRGIVRSSDLFNKLTIQRRTLIAAPKPDQGPLMERRPDRELPEINDGGMRWLRTIPIFLVILGSSCLAIFNYQKSSSSVVASTMYALRTSPKAREILGDEIYYAAKIPWIWGEINLLHGKIDIHFTVKGTKQQATMRFTSIRPTRMGLFETTEWSLETSDGNKFDLLEGNDPFKVIDADETEVRVAGRGSYAPDVSR
ncbi:DUF1783-domain-containing protein [Erysiphe pulchra]|uniref:DUF1783-domain-containing protein n=1 Tax=Erysiphe pulchra TaxID=225359 RepID=A0A2S4Q106_9PEZI|nr:DUF1783-domain-containing protein [Erysiphe pulchra]